MKESNKSKKLKSFIPLILGIIAIIGVWYILAYILKSQENYGIPYPHDTFVLSLKMLFSKDPDGIYSATSTWTGIGYTLLRLIIGYSISFVLGGILGTLSALYKPLGSFFRPSVGLFKTIPTVGVTMILFSLTLAIDHKYLGWIPIFLVIVVAFPLLFEAFKAGIENEEKEVLDALNLETGIRSPYAVFGVLLPDAFPYIRLGMAQTIGLSFKVLIMSEVLTSSNKTLGLGSLIAQSRSQTYDGGLTEIPAYVLIALLLMVIIDIPYLFIKRKK